MVYLTSFGPLQNDVAKTVYTDLTNNVFKNILLANDTASNEPLASINPLVGNDTSAFNVFSKVNRYSSATFIGIVIDTGATQRSTAGLQQFKALQSLQPDVQLDTRTKGMVNVQFGIGNTTSIGSIDLHTPIGIVQFHVMEADTPFLLCLADMDTLQVYYNNLRNVIVTKTKDVLVVRRFGHPWLLWDTSL